MNKKYCTIFLIRHAESQGNADFLKFIREVKKTELGSDLTDKGIKQAELLSQELKNIHFNAVFSSQLKRAKSTADILVGERYLAVITKKALEERRKGKFKGKSKEELKEKLKYMYGNPKDLTTEQMWKFKLFDDMESATEALERFIREIREIAVAYSSKTVLIVSHGHVMRLLLIHLGFANFNQLQSGAIENTGYIVLKTDGVDFFVKKTSGINKTF